MGLLQKIRGLAAKFMTEFAKKIHVLKDSTIFDLGYRVH